MSTDYRELTNENLERAQLIYLSIAFEQDTILTLDELNEVAPGEAMYIPQFVDEGFTELSTNTRAETEWIFDVPFARRTRLFVNGKDHWITRKDFPGAEYALHPTHLNHNYNKTDEGQKRADSIFRKIGEKLVEEGFASRIPYTD